MKPHMGIRCKNCGDELFSEHRHDWKCCSCFRNEAGNGGCFIDGGYDYVRIGGDPENYEYIRRDEHGNITTQTLEDDSIE